VTDDDPRLPALLTASRYILLDFDGPVCDIFAGLPARDVAEDLRAQLIDRFPGPLPTEIAETHDPLLIVRQVADHAPHLSPHIDAELCRAELHAVESSAPTPGAAKFLDACQATNRPVAIVSNNSAPAIRAYLNHHGLTHLVQHVHGRDPHDPRRMKPDTFLLAQTVTALGADPATSVLIGDSTTDIDAARAYGIPVIGYVNKPRKHQTLSPADALTTSMETLAELAQENPATSPAGT